MSLVQQSLKRGSWSKCLPERGDRKGTVREGIERTCRAERAEEGREPVWRARRGYFVWTARRECARVRRPGRYEVLVMRVTQTFGGC